MRRKTRSTGGRLRAAPTMRPCSWNTAEKSHVDRHQKPDSSSLLNPAMLLSRLEGHRANVIVIAMTWRNVFNREEWFRNCDILIGFNAALSANENWCLTCLQSYLNSELLRLLSWRCCSAFRGIIVISPPRGSSCFKRSQRAYDNGIIENFKAP